MPRLALPIAVVALAFATCDAACAAPSLDGFWTVKFERKPSGQAMIDSLPKGAVLIKDTGAGELAAGDFAGLKLRPAAIEQVKKYDYSQEL